MYLLYRFTNRFQHRLGDRPLPGWSNLELTFQPWYPILIWGEGAVVYIEVDQYGNITRQVFLIKNDSPLETSFRVVDYYVIDYGDRKSYPAEGRVGRLVNGNLPFYEYARFSYSIYYDMNRPFTLNGQDRDYLSGYIRQRVPEVVVELISKERIANPYLIDFSRIGKIYLYDASIGKRRAILNYPSECEFRQTYDIFPLGPNLAPDFIQAILPFLSESEDLPLTVDWSTRLTVKKVTKLADFVELNRADYPSIQDLVVRVEFTPGYPTDLRGWFLTLMDGRRFYIRA